MKDTFIPYSVFSLFLNDSSDLLYSHSLIDIDKPRIQPLILISCRGRGAVV